MQLHILCLSWVDEKVKLNELSLEEETINDATMVIEDISKKFLLYTGHKCRVSYQRNILSKIMKNKNDVLPIVIDFKMNFEATSSRESLLACNLVKNIIL